MKKNILSLSVMLAASVLTANVALAEEDNKQVQPKVEAKKADNLGGTMLADAKAAKMKAVEALTKAVTAEGYKAEGNDDLAEVVKATAGWTAAKDQAAKDTILGNVLTAVTDKVDVNKKDLKITKENLALVKSVFDAKKVEGEMQAADAYYGAVKAFDEAKAKKFDQAKFDAAMKAAQPGDSKALEAAKTKLEQEKAAADQAVKDAQGVVDAAKANAKPEEEQKAAQAKLTEAQEKATKLDEAVKANQAKIDVTAAVETAKKDLEAKEKVAAKAKTTADEAKTANDKAQEAAKATDASQDVKDAATKAKNDLDAANKAKTDADAAVEAAKTTLKNAENTLATAKKDAYAAALKAGLPADKATAVDDYVNALAAMTKLVLTANAQASAQAQFGANYALVASEMNWEAPTKAGVYARQNGMQYKTKADVAAKLDLYKTELGYVHAFGDATVGAQVEADFGRAALDGASEKTKYKNYGAKIFGTYNFADAAWAQAALGWTRVGMKNSDLGLDGHANLLIAQLGAGYEFKMDKLFVEPAVKLQYAQLGSVDYVGFGHIAYHQDSLKSLIGRLSVKGGMNLDMGKVWASACIAKDFKGNQKGSATLDRSMIGQAALTQDFSFTNKKLAYGLGLGADLTVAKNFGIEAKAGLDMGRARKAGYNFTIGGRYSF